MISLKGMKLPTSKTDKKILWDKFSMLNSVPLIIFSYPHPASWDESLQFYVKLAGDKLQTFRESLILDFKCEAFLPFWPVQFTLVKESSDQQTV